MARKPAAKKPAETETVEAEETATEAVETPAVETWTNPSKHTTIHLGNGQKVAPGETVPMTDLVRKVIGDETPA